MERFYIVTESPEELQDLAPRKAVFVKRLRPRQSGSISLLPVVV